MTPTSVFFAVNGTVTPIYNNSQQWIAVNCRNEVSHYVSCLPVLPSLLAGGWWLCTDALLVPAWCGRCRDGYTLMALPKRVSEGVCVCVPSLPLLSLSLSLCSLCNLTSQLRGLVFSISFFSAIVLQSLVMLYPSSSSPRKSVTTTQGWEGLG